MSRGPRQTGTTALSKLRACFADTETVTLTSDPLVYARRMSPANLRKTSSTLTSAWEEARRIGYWAVEGFLPYQDAADAWAVAGDAAEDIGAVKRMREARRYERAFRLRENVPQMRFEGPLLPWPEIQRFTVSTNPYGRTEMMVFPPTEVLAGATVTVNVLLRTAFRPQRLVISSTIALYFVVEELRLGQESQLWELPDDDASLPATAFNEGPLSTGMNFWGLNTGEVIALTVRNISNEPQRFTGAVMGTAFFNRPLHA